VTAAGPHGAAAFYENLGWTRVSARRTRDGTRVNTFRHPVATQNNGDSCDGGART
jgi:hypothetical protein